MTENNVLLMYELFPVETRIFLFTVDDAWLEQLKGVAHTFSNQVLSLTEAQAQTHEWLWELVDDEVFQRQYRIMDGVELLPANTTLIIMGTLV